MHGFSPQNRLTIGSSVFAGRIAKSVATAHIHGLRAGDAG